MNGCDSPAALRVRIRWTTQGLFVEYSGLPTQLIQAGAATPDMLEPGRRGFQRFDADGELYNVTRRYDTGRVTLSRWKTAARAVALPGVRAWLENTDDGGTEALARGARN